MPKVCTKCKVGTEFAKGQKWCKECQKQYRKANKKKHKEYLKTWYSNNPDYDRRRNIEKTFGISLEEYDKYFEDASCGMCGRKDSLVLDHNHEPRYIRGVLCSTCNSGIGLLRDNKELCLRGVEWIEKGEKEYEFNQSKEDI
jgi:Zn finger protein HypA/HybF involved in hydrogenase expression